MKHIVLSVLATFSLYSQNQYPTDFFISPLDIPIELAGCFGELRPNHFHSGLDIKTNKREGLNVRAVADGYVSRIKISAFGYGKAIYVTHTNGYTSLYGHLCKANGAIEKYIKRKQYLAKSYEIEVFLKPDELPVKKSDIIAFSGNTGGSGGPHLHFEFRDSKTDNIINPMLFGFDKYITDDIKPLVNGLYVYPIDENTIINKFNQPIAASLVLQKDGTYLAQKILAAGKIGFGISTSDQINNSYNKFGIYKAEIFNNGRYMFGYEFNSFSFEEFRYINALIDYQRFITTKQKVQQLFMKKPYPLSIIKTDANYGVLDVTIPNLTQIIRIEISDIHKNKTIINIPIAHADFTKTIVATKPGSQYFIKAATDNILQKKNVELYFPKNTFYNDFNMNFEVKNDTIKIHNNKVPVHFQYTIAITDTVHTNSQMLDYFIARVQNNKIEYVETVRNGNIFTGYTRDLGTFILDKDTVKPEIKITKSIENKNIANQKSIEFIISDDKTGIKSYNGFINDQWILFEYEYKHKKLTYNFDADTYKKGLNNLRIEVVDKVGNIQIFETNFYYEK